jgi:hypothetical protein
MRGSQSLEALVGHARRAGRIHGRSALDLVMGEPRDVVSSTTIVLRERRPTPSERVSVAL